MQKTLWDFTYLCANLTSEVRYEPTRDSEGKPDWTIYYKPGPRAEVEYEAFTRKHNAAIRAKAALEEGRIKKLPESAPPPGAPVSPELVAPLIKRGISEKTVNELLGNLAPDQQVTDQIEWGDYLIRESRSGKYANPPGFYIYLIRENVIPPSSFDTSRKRQLREQAREAVSQRYYQEEKLKQAYREYQDREIEAHIQRALGQDEYRRRVQAKKTELLKEDRTLSRWPEGTLNRIAARGVEADIAEEIC